MPFRVRRVGIPGPAYGSGGRPREALTHGQLGPDVNPAVVFAVSLDFPVTQKASVVAPVAGVKTSVRPVRPVLEMRFLKLNSVALGVAVLSAMLVLFCASAAAA
jgi:hypothetical protein